MDVDIAYEVTRTKMYKGKRVLYGYCMKCEHIMYPESILDKLRNKLLSSISLIPYKGIFVFSFLFI